ncbi:MAG: hypothetical protein PVG53_12690 [Holophagae bacterium]|jgi:hypothetical protein
MRRFILAAACIVLVPALATAQTYTASLSGDTGSGFGTITISGNTIDYNILVSGIDATGATLTDGSDEVDLGASFTGGTAIGSTTSSLAADIATSPASWTLEVNDGALSGALSAGGAGGGTTAYFPVQAAVAGAAGSNFRTDLRIVNKTSATVSVTVDYYAAGADANTAPDATFTVDVAANEQRVLNDYVASQLGVANGRGGVVVTADGAVTVVSRVYTAGDEGTFGLFVDSVGMDDAMAAGVIPFLQNRPANSGAGFRGSIGWFNPNTSAVNVTLRGWDTSGTLLGETSLTANALTHDQEFINGLWAALADYGDMYVTFSADGPLFMYGTITDNATNDGTYIPAK